MSVIVRLALMMTLSLLLVCVARANEADDTIARLAGQARAQAGARAGDDVRRTLADISALIPQATLQGVATANALLAELSKTLPKDDGASPAKPSRPPAAVAGQVDVPPEPPPPIPPTAVPPRPVMSESMRALMQRQGDAALHNGDISGARRFYQKGAEGGCAACAEALADTFSADWLKASGAVGIKADQTQSDVWRALARQLTQATNQ